MTATISKPKYKGFWDRLLRIFTDIPLVNQIQKNFEEMLLLSQSMYISITTEIMDPESSTLESIRDGFFSADERINELEQKIRREILVHLSISKEKDISQATFLLFLNMIKDAERLGDYTKNIFGIFEKSSRFLNGEILETFQKMRLETIRFYGEIHAAISTRDSRLAQKCAEQIDPLSDECKAILNRMMTDPGDTTNPVAVALLFRYQKRIFSHLRKIAVSQYSPFDKIGTIGKEEA